MTMAYELFALPDFPRPSLDLCEPMVPHIKCSPRENVVGSGMHKHRCDCGATWKHSNNIEQGTQEQFDHAHACPDCGKRQLWKFGQW
jgi:DNA-directed RNA polymerase subunit RPC12/RpoP